jgi:serine protease AprX
VTITVHNANNVPVSGVLATGKWSNGYTGTSSCTTGSTGSCSVSTGNIKNIKTSVTFTTSNLSKSGYTYNAAANHDPDGDSNGTQITVTKP